MQISQLFTVNIFNVPRNTVLVSSPNSSDHFPENQAEQPKLQARLSFKGCTDRCVTILEMEEVNSCHESRQDSPIHISCFASPLPKYTI